MRTRQWRSDSVETRGSSSDSTHQGNVSTSNVTSYGAKEATRHSLRSHHSSDSKHRETEALVRALRRHILTCLIQRYYYKWIAFADSPPQRLPPRIPLTVVAVECINRFVTQNRYLTVKRYFHSWRQWSGRALRRKAGTLNRMRRRALLRLGVVYFLKWCTLCFRRQQALKCRTFARVACVALMRQYYHRWISHWRRRNRQRVIAAPALRHLQRSAVRGFMRTSLHHWWMVTAKRKAQRVGLQRIRQASMKAMALSVLLRWKRRRHRRVQIVESQRMHRRLLRGVAREAFRRWKMFIALKGICLAVEQRALRAIAQRYLRRWVESVRKLIISRELLSITRRRVQASHYARWQQWFLRIVRAYQLEQLHLVVVLQRYYAKWRMSFEEKQLSYKALRSFSAALRGRSPSLSVDDK